MTQTSTPRRYRLLTRYAGTMAQVIDTAHVDFGKRGCIPTVTVLLDIDEARKVAARLEAEKA